MGVANITAKEIEQEAKEVRTKEKKEEFMFGRFSRRVERCRKANRPFDVRANYRMIIPP